MYNIHINNNHLVEITMNDYDATFVWDYEISCHEDLDENYSYNMQDSWDLDEEYARDSYDYTELAYTYYA